VDDEGSFSTPPPWTDWDTSVRVQQDALWASLQVGDLMGQARAHNALGMLCLRRGYDSNAYGAFRDCLAILEKLGDTRHTPVVRMHLAQSRIGVAGYQEAGDILAESLAAFRERGDTASRDEALRLLATIQGERKRWFPGQTPTIPLLDRNMAATSTGRHPGCAPASW
jgi:hypothetical protein